jgi:hypothetical protein
MQVTHVKSKYQPKNDLTDKHMSCKTLKQKIPTGHHRSEFGKVRSTIELQLPEVATKAGIKQYKPCVLIPKLKCSKKNNLIM